MSESTVSSHLIPHESAVDFILAGNSHFTFLENKTMQRFTYKVHQHHENENLFHVSVLNGADNNSAYRILMDIVVTDMTPQCVHRPKYWIKEDAPSFKFFKKYFYNLMFEMMMPSFEIWHIGRCCRCGRLLTVPESIVAGVGPECASMIKSWK